MLDLCEFNWNIFAFRSQVAGPAPGVPSIVVDDLLRMLDEHELEVLEHSEDGTEEVHFVSVR